jgi:hypothetical protein
MAIFQILHRLRLLYLYTMPFLAHRAPLGALSVFMLPAWRRKTTKEITMLRSVIVGILAVVLMVGGIVDMVHNGITLQPGSAAMYVGVIMPLAIVYAGLGLLALSRRMEYLAYTHRFAR